jgi:ferredoxin-NADP reductase
LKRAPVSELRPALVESVRDLTPVIRLLRLLPGGGGPFSFRPGQWVILHLREGSRWVGRHYSIASHLELLPRIEICVGRPAAEDGGGGIVGVQLGDRVELSGPGGGFLLREDPARELLFIANGTGVSPFRPMIPEALGRSGAARVTLVLGARTRDDLLFREEWEALERSEARFRFVPVLSRPGGEWRGARGYAQDAATGLLRGGDQEVYVCGMHRMVAAVRERCASAGVPPDRVHFERHD